MNVLDKTLWCRWWSGYGSWNADNMNNLEVLVEPPQCYPLESATLSALADNWSRLPYCWAQLKARQWPNELPGREPLDKRSPRVVRIMQLILSNVGREACQVEWDRLPATVVAIGRGA